MRMQNTVPVAALVVVALILSGCGGQEEERPGAETTGSQEITAREAFIDQANEACRRAAGELGKLGSGSPADYSESTVSKFRTAAPIYHILVSDLRSIPVPSGEESSAGALIETWEQVSDKVDEMVEAADLKKGRRFEARAEEFWGLLGRAIDANHEFGITCP